MDNHNIYKLFKGLTALLFSVFKLIKTILTAIKDKLWEKYLSVSLSEKIIILAVIPAFFAIILPVARFYIFGSYFYINNPLAVYMIGIAILMLVTAYFNRFIKLIIRLVVNLYYLFWIIYIPLAGELTKAKPYEIYFGYYLNIAVSVIFIIASLIAFYSDRQ